MTQPVSNTQYILKLMDHEMVHGQSFNILERVI